MAAPAVFVPRLATLAGSYSLARMGTGARLPPASADALADFLTHADTGGRHTGPPKIYPGFRGAVLRLEALVNGGALEMGRLWAERSAQAGLGEVPAFSFHGHLLPWIWNVADAAGSAPAPPGCSDFALDEMASLILPAGKPGSRRFTARSIMQLLANALLFNVGNAGPDHGSIDMGAVYGHGGPVAIERTLCLLAYFFQAFAAGDSADLDRVVTVERLQCAAAPSGAPFAPPMTPVPAASVRVHAGPMEDPPGAAFFDFANSCIHIHTIIPSATQEEVLFSACPEAFAAVLLLPELRADEVAVLRGVRRVCAYTGYGRTFRFAGLAGAAHRDPFDILVADACFAGHYLPATVRRDVGKAHAIFAAARGDVSTGHWGCGVFGGAKDHKFAQQILAFSRAAAERAAAGGAPARLHYSTFGEEGLAERFRGWLRAMEARGTTCGELEGWLMEFREGRTFGEVLDEKLGTSE